MGASKPRLLHDRLVGGKEGALASDQDDGRSSETQVEAQGGTHSS